MPFSLLSSPAKPTVASTVCCLLFMMMLSVADAAIIPDLKFRRLDTRDGLSHSQVNCILRDSKGFIWIGTPYGLNRYDGYRFRTFYSNLRDTTTMRDNYVDHVFEAYDGRLWIKQGMNYSMFDPKTERFERNISRPLTEYGINGSVEWFFIDEQKNFWVKVYDEGFYCYNPTEKKLTLVKNGYEKGQFNPTYGVSSMASYGSHQIVVATNNGELVCLDGKQGKVIWVNRWMREHGGPENQHYGLKIDDNGNYWVVTVGYTFVYIKSENRWYSQMTDFLREHGIPDVPEQMEVWDTMRDKHGWLWIATDHLGVFVVDLKNRQMKEFVNSKYDDNTISENTTRHLYQDPAGQVWVGTYKNGVNQYHESTSNFSTLELGDITTALEDCHGNFWLGTNDRGIIAYDPRTGEYEQYDTSNSPLSSNVVVGSCVASDGSFWFGSYNGGLTHCIPRKQGDPRVGATIVNYRSTGSPDALSSNNVWSVTEDKWHRIWIATLGGGVQSFDPKTGRFRTWNSKNTKLPNDYLTSASWIKKGWLMVGTSNYYALINPVTGKLANQIIPEDPAITVNLANSVCVMEDSRGLVWQGSTSGACVYDPKTGFVKLLDMTNGLFGSSVCSIAEDHHHLMWVVTDHGVSKVIPQQQQDGSWQFIISSYNERDGLQKATYNQRSTFVTRKGLLLIGGQGGLDIIDPNRIAKDKGNERPLFSGLQVFDEDVTVGQEVNGRVVLDEALHLSSSISLRYSENNFTIQLGSDAGIVNNRKRFIYQLEGFRDSWTKTSEKNPNITFMSLRYGDYTLRVRMLNDDGTMGDVESALDIHISPPLWRARWAMLLYVVAVGVGVWWWRRRFLRQQAERLRQQTMHREV